MSRWERDSREITEVITGSYTLEKPQKQILNSGIKYIILYHYLIQNIIIIIYPNM